MPSGTSSDAPAPTILTSLSLSIGTMGRPLSGSRGRSGGVAGRGDGGPIKPDFLPSLLPRALITDSPPNFGVFGLSTSLTSESLPSEMLISEPSATRRTSLSLPGLGRGDAGPPFFRADLRPADGVPDGVSRPISTFSSPGSRANSNTSGTL